MKDIPTATQFSRLQKIIDSMAPDLKEWEYKNEMIDDANMQSFCACGQNIRYVFVIRRERDNASLNIGSTCIKRIEALLIEHGAEGLARSLFKAKTEWIARKQHKDQNSISLVLRSTIGPKEFPKSKLHWEPGLHRMRIVEAEKLDDEGLAIRMVCQSGPMKGAVLDEFWPRYKYRYGSKICPDKTFKACRAVGFVDPEGNINIPNIRILVGRELLIEAVKSSTKFSDHYGRETVRENITFSNYRAIGQKEEL